MLYIFTLAYTVQFQLISRVKQKYELMQVSSDLGVVNSRRTAEIREQ